MFNFKKFRLPFRDDLLFSILSFAVFIVPLIFSFQLYEKFETLKISLLLLLLGWAGVVLAVSAVKAKGVAVSVHRPALWAAGALAVWILISSFHAATLLNAVAGTYPRYTSSAFFYLAVIAFFTLLLLTLNREKLLYLLKLLLADGLAVAVVGLLQSFGIAYYTGAAVVGLQRGPSLLGNPDFSSMFLAVLLPINLYFLAAADKRWSKIYYAINVAVSLAAVVVFASRGAWLGAAAGLVLTVACFAVFSAPKKFVLTSLVVIVAGAGLFIALLHKISPASLKQTFSLTESNLSLRLYAWDIAGQAMLEHPVLGTGPGNFQYYFQAHRGFNLADQPSVFDDVHNLFLQFGASLGLPFLLAFLAIITLAGLAGVKASWRTGNLLPLALAISLVVFCLVACFTPVPSPCFVVLGVLLAGLLLPQARVQTICLAKPVSLLISIAAVAGVVAGLALMASEFIFYQGYLDYYNDNFHRAFQLTNLARIINPTDQLIWVYRTASEVQLGTPTSVVLADEDRYIKLYPLDQRGYLTAANISFLQFLLSHDQSALQRSSQLLEHDVALDPNNSFRYSHLAIYYYAQGKLAQSQQTVEYSLKLNSNNVPAWLLLARILQANGEVVAAKNAIGNALKQDPGNQFLQDLSTKAQQTAQKNFNNLQIPLLFNPNEIE